MSILFAWVAMALPLLCLSRLIFTDQSHSSHNIPPKQLEHLSVAYVELMSSISSTFEGVFSTACAEYTFRSLKNEHKFKVNKVNLNQLIANAGQLGHTKSCINLLAHIT